MKNVEIIDNSVKVACNLCSSKGECKNCHGTKEYTRDRFILVTKYKGQKIAFDVDNPGK